MVKNIILAISTGLFLSLPYQAIAEESSPVPAKQPDVTSPATLVRGTRVSITKSDNFAPAPNFSGFVDKATQASIMVTEMPSPFEATTAGFNEAGLASRAMKLVSKEAVTVGDYPGILCSVKQTAYGSDFSKWILAFGNEEQTIVVTASYPDSSADKLSESLKQILLTARYDAKAKPPDPMADLPFTISGSKNLLMAGRIQNTLLFSPTGKITAIDPKDPSLFLVGQALNDLEIPDKTDFARTRLKMTANLTDVQIISEKDITVAGMPTREILATGKNKQGAELFVLQDIAYGGGSYFFLQGITDLDQKEDKEPEFRAIVDSFRLK
ncbi:MAG: hypothetical protein WCT03_12750 [Candidatus Obscuribacterales bacterium]